MRENTLRTIKIILTVLLILGLCALLGVINMKGLRAKKSEFSTYYFKTLRLETFSGGTYTAAELKKNTLTVFTVWNPYCTACIREMPLLDALDREYSEKGVRILGIEGEAYLYPDEVEKARGIVESSKTAFLQLLADQAFTEQVLPRQNNSYPANYLVDSYGNILDFHLGTLSEEGWRAWIEGWLIKAA